MSSSHQRMSLCHAESDDKVNVVNLAHKEIGDMVIE